jgi:hypothetical protein
MTAGTPMIEGPGVIAVPREVVEGNCGTADPLAVRGTPFHLKPVSVGYFPKKGAGVRMQLTWLARFPLAALSLR